MNRIQLWLSIGVVAAVCAGGAIGCGGRSGDHAPPSLLQFGSATFSVDENGGSATIAVTRSGSTTGSVSVDFATSDATATAGSDYDAASGTLTWADGDSADKTFTITIHDDACLEGDETVDLALANPTGRSLLGLLAAAALTIVEDDTQAPGSLDPLFGTGGIVVDNPSTGYDTYAAVAIDATYLYAVGFDEVPGVGDWQWRIEKRLLSDGSLDPLFGIGGVVTSKPSVLDDSAWGVAIDSTFIYVTGYDESPGSGDWQWRTEKRYISDGSPDTNFGIGGAVVDNPSPDDDTPWALAVDSTFVYIVGYDETAGSGDLQWRIEKRFITDGLPDPGFGNGGVVTSNPSLQDDYPMALAIDSTFIYIVGDDEALGSIDSQWRIEKRYLSDGTFDATFGNGGVIQENPSPSYDEAANLAIDSTFMYVIGSDMTPSGSDSQWRIEKRALADGLLDPAFGTSGVVTDNPSGIRDWAWGVDVDGSSLYVCGTDESPGAGNRQWRILKLSSADGSPDPCFGTGGVVTSDPSLLQDYAWWIVADPSHIYIVGEDQANPPGDRGLRIEKRLK